jgi:hypothetical protein
VNVVDVQYSDCVPWSTQTLRHANHAIKPAPWGAPGARERIAARGGRGSRTGIALRMGCAPASPVSSRRQWTDEGSGRALPKFVTEELRGFLNCGILARGFAHLFCDARFGHSRSWTQARPERWRLCWRHQQSPVPGRQTFFFRCATSHSRAPPDLARRALLCSTHDSHDGLPAMTSNLPLLPGKEMS